MHRDGAQLAAGVGVGQGHHAAQVVVVAPGNGVGPQQGFIYRPEVRVDQACVVEDLFFDIAQAVGLLAVDAHRLRRQVGVGTHQVALVEDLGPHLGVVRPAGLEGAEVGVVPDVGGAAELVHVVVVRNYPGNLRAQGVVEVFDGPAVVVHRQVDRAVGVEHAPGAGLEADLAVHG